MHEHPCLRGRFRSIAATIDNWARHGLSIRQSLGHAMFVGSEGKDIVNDYEQMSINGTSRTTSDLDNTRTSCQGTF